MNDLPGEDPYDGRMVHFDSVEDAMEAIKQSHSQLDASLLPQQLRMLEQDEVWFVRFAGEVTVFGHSDLRALIAEEVRLWREGPPEPWDSAEKIEERLREQRTRGHFLYGWHYSTVEPTGELGSTHAALTWPISQEAFEEARATGWTPMADDSPALSLCIHDMMRTLDEVDRG